MLNSSYCAVLGQQRVLKKSFFSFPTDGANIGESMLHTKHAATDTSVVCKHYISEFTRNLVLMQFYST